MTPVFLLFGLLAIAQGRLVELNGLSSRIVNGEDAELGDRPFQVSLQYKGFRNQMNHFCGGSIINKDWVVTGAHCIVVSANYMKVIVGTINLSNPYKTHIVEKTIVHEKYDSYSNENDIALIKVVTPFEFSDIVKPVALPEAHFEVKTNSSAVVSGWGGLKNSQSPTSDRLQKVQIYIADHEYCVNVMKTVGREVFPTNVCANDPSKRRGQCNGDSGGPLTVDGTLIGIVSWSVKDTDCASTKYPGIYTRVSEYIDWIAENSQ